MREGWGNLWEELGPVAESVMRGEALAPACSGDV